MALSFEFFVALLLFKFFGILLALLFVSTQLLFSVVAEETKFRRVPQPKFLRDFAFEIRDGLGKFFLDFSFDFLSLLLVSFFENLTRSQLFSLIWNPSLI